MNKVIRLACAVCIGLGAFFAMGIHLGDQRPTLEVSSPDVEGAGEPPPVSRPQANADFAPSSTPAHASPPAADGSLPYDNHRNAEFRSEATRYALSFQPGVTVDDSPPLFVTLFEESVGSSAITNLFRQHKQAPPDGWSAAMEYRLGQFLEAQPEISKTRASASCRPSRCLIQFMELPPPPGERPTSSSVNAKTMVLRLMKEPWFPEEFMEGGLPLSTPARGDTVQYMVQILNRRPVVR